MIQLRIAILKTRSILTPIMATNTNHRVYLPYHSMVATLLDPLHRPKILVGQDMAVQHVG